MHRWLISTLIAVVVVAAASSAAAAPGDGSEQGSGGRSGDVITAAVSYSSDGSDGGGSGGARACSWEMVDGSVGVPNLGIATWPHTAGGVTYHLWKRTCPDGVAWVQIAETTPQDLLPALLEELREQRALSEF